jgi:hypothetical protein
MTIMLVMLLWVCIHTRQAWKICLATALQKSMSMLNNVVGYWESGTYNQGMAYIQENQGGGWYLEWGGR